ncbi:hypothetical protein AB6F61_00795 [Providencia hangzhouensis]|uniref:hypothetical protein n=1 Tax=Providencia hangzhouensis TaxID=3031799 RepID=UPI0034DD579A
MGLEHYFHHNYATDCIAMQQLSESLSDMQIANAILSGKKKFAYLFMLMMSWQLCRLKASGVAIAELSSGFLVLVRT